MIFIIQNSNFFLPNSNVDLLLLLLSKVESINNDLIGMYLNCDYLRCGYAEVYARTIFYEMKQFILVNVIVSNIDGKGTSTTNNESLLMCIDAK